MTLELVVEGRSITFSLDSENKHWRTPEKLMEGYFPLIAEVGGKRLELYSDETFAEVELD